MAMDVHKQVTHVHSMLTMFGVVHSFPCSYSRNLVSGSCNQLLKQMPIPWPGLPVASQCLETSPKTVTSMNSLCVSFLLHSMPWPHNNQTMSHRHN